MSQVQTYQSQQFSSGQGQVSQPIVPEVIVHPRYPMSSNPLEFPAVVQTVDGVAKRVPWWIWLVVGVLLGRGALGLMGRFMSPFRSS